MQPSVGMFLLGSIGVPEVLIIILIAIIVFGGKRLGEIGKGLGEGIRNFKSAVKSEKPAEGDKNDKPAA